MCFICWHILNGWISCPQCHQSVNHSHISKLWQVKQNCLHGLITTRKYWKFIFCSFGWTVAILTRQKVSKSVSVLYSKTALFENQRGMQPPQHRVTPNPFTVSWWLRPAHSQENGSSWLTIVSGQHCKDVTQLSILRTECSFVRCMYVFVFVHQWLFCQWLWLCRRGRGQHLSLLLLVASLCPSVQMSWLRVCRQMDNNNHYQLFIIAAKLLHECILLWTKHKSCWL